MPLAPPCHGLYRMSAMKYHYVWLFWSSAFLLPWLALYAALPAQRAAMWKATQGTNTLKTASQHER